MIWFNLLTAIAVGTVLGIIDAVRSLHRWKNFTNAEIISAYQRGVERGREIGRAEARTDLQNYLEDE